MCRFGIQALETVSDGYRNPIFLIELEEVLTNIGGGGDNVFFVFFVLFVFFVFSKFYFYLNKKKKQTNGCPPPYL